MNKGKIISLILSLIYLPIGLYITYWILTQLNPDRFIWFLFIIEIPLIFLIAIINKVIED